LAGDRIDLFADAFDLGAAQDALNMAAEALNENGVSNLAF